MSGPRVAPPAPPVIAGSANAPTTTTLTLRSPEGQAQTTVATTEVPKSAPAAMDTFIGLNEAGAALLTGLAAAIIAIVAILTQRAIASRKATLDFIRTSEADRDILKARVLFNILSLDEDGMGKWAKAEHAKSKEANAIRVVLNELELVAIGIDRGILDDTTYRRFWRSGVIRSWQAAQPYVLLRRQRTGNDALYHEVEELARYYQGGRRMPKRRFFWRKFF